MLDGRETVFVLCDGCHSIKLVVQQRLSCESWDKALVWMVEEQDMAELDDETREAVLDYLGTYLSAETPR